MGVLLLVLVLVLVLLLMLVGVMVLLLLMVVLLVLDERDGHGTLDGCWGGRRRRRGIGGPLAVWRWWEEIRVRKHGTPKRIPPRSENQGRGLYRLAVTPGFGCCRRYRRDDDIVGDFIRNLLRMIHLKS